MRASDVPALSLLGLLGVWAIVSLVFSPFLEFALLAVLGLLLAFASLRLGWRWPLGPGLTMLGIAYLPTDLATNVTVAAPMAYVALLFLLAAVADHGLLVRSVGERIKGSPEEEGRLTKIHRRTLVAMATAVGASYLLALVLLQAGLFVAVDVASEWAAFALAVAVLVVVTLLASLARSPGDG